MSHPLGMAFVLLGACAAPVAAGCDDAPESSAGNDSPAVATADVPAEPAGPPRQEPIDCDGDEQVQLDGVTIVNEAGPAIRARGDCRVTLTDSDLRGSDVGVEASGSAIVILRDGRVSGGEAAVVATGEAQVSLLGADAVGEVRVQGGGEEAPDG